MAIHHDLNQSAINSLPTSPRVQANMLRRGIRVQNQARRLLTQRKPGVDTGRLRASVSVEQFIRGGVIVTRIGSNVEYAIYVHEGTRYMRGNPFLRDALPAAVGA